MTQLPEDTILTRFLFDISESDIVEAVSIKSTYYSASKSQWRNNMVPGSVFKNKPGCHKIENIENLLSRTTRLYFLSRDKKIYHYTHNGAIVEITLDPSVFSMGGEIVQMAAGYDSLFLLVKYASGTTRVFCETESITFKYATKVDSIVSSRKILISNSGTDESRASWVEILDFKTLLQHGEHIIHVGCAAFTCVYLSSRGKLYSVGSNQFAEMGVGYVSGSSSAMISEIKPCVIDPECKKQPFFIKTVHGDHNIVALTNDGRVFICGYSLGVPNTSHQGYLTQIKPERSNVIFTDICSGYYTLYALTARTWIGFNLNNLGIPLVSAKLYSAPYDCFVVINNRVVYNFDSTNEDKLVHDTQKIPRSGCELQVVCDYHLICYWKQIKKEPTKMFLVLKKMLSGETALNDITFEF